MAKPRTEADPERESGNSATLRAARTVSAGTGVHGVGGDRMVGSWGGMNQGSRSGEGAAFMAAGGARRTAPGR